LGQSNRGLLVSSQPAYNVAIIFCLDYDDLPRWTAAAAPFDCAAGVSARASFICHVDCRLDSADQKSRIGAALVCG